MCSSEVGDRNHLLHEMYCTCKYQIIEMGIVIVETVWSSDSLCSLIDIWFSRDVILILTYPWIQQGVLHDIWTTATTAHTSDIVVIPWSNELNRNIYSSWSLVIFFLPDITIFIKGKVHSKTVIENIGHIDCVWSRSINHIGLNAVDGCVVKVACHCQAPCRSMLLWLAPVYCWYWRLCGEVKVR